MEAVDGASHQPDLDAEEAFHALLSLSQLAWGLQNNDFSQGVIKVFSFIVRLGRIRIRRHEDTLLRSIYDRVRIKDEPADYDSPYWKILLLLQAHFNRLPLSPELAADLAIVLERVFFLFSVCARRYWSGSDVDLDIWPFRIFYLMHMCVHGMWDVRTQSELEQIPHFEGDVSCSINRPGLWLIHASGHPSFPCSTHRVCARGREHECE
jgi:hypothetical protein